MRVMADFRALAGQTPVRVLAKAAISLLAVMLATLFSREGAVLAILIIFTGVTGPAIRLVTMKLDGTFDRIIVSPVSKPVFVTRFAVLWTIAALLPLVPAVFVVAVLHGPVIIIPVLLGTILATALGTLAGFVARGLSDGHLGALILAGVLIPLSIVQTPAAVFLPCAALSLFPVSPDGLVISAILPAAGIVILAVTASRS
jgi:hypothetical protein